MFSIEKNSAMAMNYNFNNIQNTFNPYYNIFYSILFKEGQSLRNCVKEMETNSVSIDELEVDITYRF